jgi:Phage Mu protein F like protein
MNKEQRELYSLQTIRRNKRFERAFLKPVYTVLKNEMRRAAKMVRSGKATEYLASWIIIDGLASRLQNLIETVGLFYAKLTTREIVKSQTKGFGLDQEWINLINEYFRTDLLNKAVLPISNTTRAKIFQMITDGVQNGWSIDRIAFELENSEFPLWRARMIVRTEIQMAQNIGKRVASEESEFETVKQWISAHDSRTRTTHMEVDGKMVSEDGRFKVRKLKGGFDLMNGPGDPEASAGNIINCRCTSAVVAKRDENGRLIRKRKISVLLPSDINRQRKVVTI